ncbi:MAG TPA: hypothetical protein VFZ16_02870 [Hyphomicrobiaceae bacterium]|nr:hypothetical protein [Hyphomicrobiaceae bacterium]
MSFLVIHDGGLRHAGRLAAILAATAALLLGLVRIPDGPPGAASAAVAHEPHLATHP